MAATYATVGGLMQVLHQTIGARQREEEERQRRITEQKRYEEEQRRKRDADLGAASSTSPANGRTRISHGISWMP